MSQRIPQEVIEDIRTRTNIVDVVGQYVQLKKSGKNFFGLCPFHEERSPSFSVAEDKQIYYCFGCGKGGNVFNFIQEVEGLNFPAAVQKTAEISNLPLNYTFTPEQQDQELSATQQHDRVLLQVHETAAELYHHVLLNTQAGEAALDYLLARGLSKELITEFQIGFAPRERTLLQQVLAREHISTEALRDSGLMTVREDGSMLDRFYQRIIFPIKNTQGKIVAFSGRILLADDYDTSRMPKYLNSPETAIFNKRQVLFNFHQAKNEGRKAQEIILFEGFMDVIAAWAAGVKHGVASMGTSLTQEQLQMIQRQSQNVLLCYDGDHAGQEASLRALTLIEKETTLEVSLIRLTDGLDPDDYIKKYGAEQFANLIKNGRETPFTFKMHHLKQGRNLQNEQERFNYLEDLLKELVKVPSVIEREVYTQQLAQEFDISTEAITSEIRQLQQNDHQAHRQERHERRQERDRREQVIPQVQQVQRLSVGEKAEEMLLYRIMHERGVQAEINQLPDFAFSHDHYQELYQHINDYLLTQAEFSPADFINYLQADYLKKLFVKISYLNLSEASSPQEIKDYLVAIEQETLRKKQQEKIIAQREASRTGNKQLEQELALEIINLQRKLKRVGI